jgi:aspartate/methionine/tyrosine aminotransferase
VGEPDFDTPAHIVEAGVAALRAGHTHYAPPQGLPELRAAVARYVGRTLGRQPSPREVVVGSGVKPLIYLCLAAVLEEGDEVLLPSPAYPGYASICALLGARPVPVPMDSGRGFRLDAEEVARRLTPRSRLLLLNSPANPTGAVLAPEDLESLGALAREHDLWVLSDEIYSRHVYEGRHHSLWPALPERTFLLDGCSKAWAMTGWRVGWAVLPEPLVEPVTLLLLNTLTCVPPFVQHAALAALEGPQEPLEAMVAQLRRRRDLLVEGLNRLPGFRCPRPAGAFYAFPDIRGTGRSSEELAWLLLEETGVCCTPGSAYGGEGFLRFSYATSPENLRLALERLERALGRSGESPT